MIGAPQTSGLAAVARARLAGAAGVDGVVTVSGAADADAAAAGDER